MATFENINIEKGMYQTKGGLTEALEKLDPSENYVGTSLEGLDAFSRQLKRYDIRVSGRGSDCVEKFFQTSNSAALFPEYVSRAVRQGMERADILPNLVATVTDIEGMDYRSIVSAPTDDEKSLKIVGEGAAIPQTTVRTPSEPARTSSSSTREAECSSLPTRLCASSDLTSSPSLSTRSARISPALSFMTLWMF